MVEFKKNKIFEEKTKPESGRNKEGHIGVANNPGVAKFKAEITNNSSISSKDISNLKKELKVSIFGQVMTKEEISKIPDITLTVSKEIMEGNIVNHGELTLLFPDVLKKLKTLNENLGFSRITSLDDNQIEILSKNKGCLYLDGLTSINDNQAESLSRHKGVLCLRGLTSINDNQAESLSRHKEGLHLDGLTSINDNQAESLSKHKRELSLLGLTSLTDSQAESFSKHKGWL